MRSANAASSVNRGAVAGYFWPAFLFILGAAFVIHALVFGRAPAVTNFGVMAGGLFALFGLLLGAFQYVARSKAASGGGV